MAEAVSDLGGWTVYPGYSRELYIYFLTISYIILLRHDDLFRGYKLCILNQKKKMNFNEIEKVTTCSQSLLLSTCLSVMMIVPLINQMIFPYV